ncbi:MAG: peptidoglycan DD-metalloendopeptidase family protein [Sedimentisphaerales bacterium]|nr:peptidoglycan DD-metalloendopeptidase family protein [Sedimentisphaerales bacterium]
MRNTNVNIHRACLLAAALLVAAFLPVRQAETAGPAATDDNDSTAIDRAMLVNKRFEFSWSSGQQGGVNGIATLRQDGSIAGIRSPNETSWRLDEAGRLLFLHADGRVSTRYDKVWREAGRLRFEGHFLFRGGIQHHLVEIEDAAEGSLNEITPAQAAAIKYSTQQFVYLDPGQTYAFRLKDGSERQIRLVSVQDYQDPVIHLARRAEVTIEIDGAPVELTCSPYAMPTEIRGLRIQADTTSAWLDTPKRVQFSLWDASNPIVDTELFGFPLPGYRLFSHGMQAYNEPVHLGHRDGDPAGQRFYHNYGVDLAGYEGRQKVLSCISGVVFRVNREEGDLIIRDDTGFLLHFGHLDSILAGIRPGIGVRRGQWIGMLGRRGGSGNFSHLHIGAYLSESALATGRAHRNLNLYPWLVAAYQQANGTDLYAVARPHQMALTGDTVRFDGRSSLAFRSKITGFRWEFDDGTSVEAPTAQKAYEQPGCHMAALWIRDDQGRIDVDFCKVKVFSRPDPEDVIATLFVTYTPSAPIRVDQAITFRIWPQSSPVEDIQIDFGDGTIIRDYRPYSAIVHAFRRPGIHIVTVSGTAGGLPVTQKVKVVVAAG